MSILDEVAGTETMVRVRPAGEARLAIEHEDRKGHYLVQRRFKNGKFVVVDDAGRKFKVDPWYLATGPTMHDYWGCRIHRYPR